MAKHSFAVIVLAAMLCVSFVSASPFISKEAIHDIRVKVSAAIDALVDKDPSGMAKTMVDKFRGPVSAAIDTLIDRMHNRRKRSIQANYAMTKINGTHYQKVEMNKTWDKDPQEKSIPTCLVKENEIIWLEYMSNVMIFLTQEMKKVLDGKLVPFKMSKDAYNQQKGHF